VNALLVYPEYPETFWSFKHALQFVRKKASFPPLGLLTVASMLPKGWNRRLVDCNVRPLEDEDIEWADIVLISAMVVQSQAVKRIVSRCVGKTVVAGGPLFANERFVGIDHYVLNEAEVTLPRFLEDLKAGRAKGTYSSDERPDIHKTPLPDWSLIDPKQYMSLAVQYSRGCPFNCEFCDIIVMNGRIPRTKKPQQMIREMQAVFDTGHRGSVFIVDDNFIGNKQSAKEMLRALSRWQKKNRYPFVLMTEASINLAEDEELMQLMSAANFDKVFLGLETPAIDSLKECGKIQNTKGSLSEAVRKIHRNGMQVMGGFIVGFDSDTEGIFDAQISFIQEIGVVTAMVGLLNAVPQTRLWHRLKAEGRLVSETSGENTDGSLNFVPAMGKERLVAGYKKIIARIYSHKHYYRRIKTFLKQYRQTSRKRLTLSDIRACLWSMWRIGVLSRARFYYWRMIIRTGFTRTRSLPVAVELAIIGLHFDRFARRIAA
jgi:radical SAM superfamily enzyme YgiQ (UPF0313 family)